jgi:hypothetical protein
VVVVAVGVGVVVAVAVVVGAMTPTNEQVVAACLRAGIPYVCSVGNSICVSDYTVNPHDDTGPGSALFIVAVLGALPIFEGETLVRRFCDEWFVRGHCALTLTAACMAAIVAAYPEQETTT